LLTKWFRKSNVADDAPAKKSMCERLFGAIEKLIRQHNIAGPVSGLKRAHGADADNPRHAKLFHRPNICAMIQFAGQNAMASAMPRKEHHVATSQSTGEQFIRR